MGDISRFDDAKEIQISGLGLVACSSGKYKGETKISHRGRKRLRYWLFSDTPDGASANALYLTIVEMAKAYGLNLYEYLKYLLEHRPNKDMTDDELSKLAPWNEDVQKNVANRMSKMLAYRNPSNRVPICFEDTLKLCAY